MKRAGVSVIPSMKYHLIRSQWRRKMRITRDKSELCFDDLCSYFFLNLIAYVSQSSWMYWMKAAMSLTRSGEYFTFRISISLLLFILKIDFTLRIWLWTHWLDRNSTLKMSFYSWKFDVRVKSLSKKPPKISTGREYWFLDTSHCL